MTEYCLGFAFTVDYAGYQRVLLIRKIHPDWQAGRLNGIGGKIEAGETPHRAMAREFREEAGLESLPTAWVKFAEMHFGLGEVIVYCFTTWWEWKIFKRAISKTEEQICSYLLDERFFHKMRDEKALPNLHWLIPMAQAAWWISDSPVLKISELPDLSRFHDPSNP